MDEEARDPGNTEGVLGQGLINLLGKPHEARILVTGTSIRLRNKKEKTVLNLACMACGEIFETGGYSVQNILDAVAEHKQKTGVE